MELSDNSLQHQLNREEAMHSYYLTRKFCLPAFNNGSVTGCSLGKEELDTPAPLHPLKKCMRNTHTAELGLNRLLELNTMQ
ncbi:hypothetical protein AALO_G00079670 [Alosa alosa]|uniref:Uncharacterized protein n=1 Tax=Alosa alosa TaxID=278164 RepID=A0AAV6H0X8_9TELE|nr:hypothetical protein AALO_G00079670 [Alosa alosa]